MRLPHYDYSSAGAYFVTLCTKDKNCLFGRVEEGAMLLNNYGEMAERFLQILSVRYPGVILDEYVVMPNHVHAVLIIMDGDVGETHEPPLRRKFSLPLIMGFYKMNTAKELNQLRQTPGCPVWQRSYYERVIRNENELREIRSYIRNNPTQWEINEEHC
jgi:putative transposase